MIKIRLTYHDPIELQYELNQHFGKCGLLLRKGHAIVKFYEKSANLQELLQKIQATSIKGIPL